MDDDVLDDNDCRLDRLMRMEAAIVRSISDRRPGLHHTIFCLKPDRHGAPDSIFLEKRKRPWPKKPR